MRSVRAVFLSLVLSIPGLGATPSECLIAIVQEAITRPAKAKFQSELHDLDEAAQKLTRERNFRVSSWIMRSLSAIGSQVMKTEAQEKPLLSYRLYYEYKTGETRPHPCAGEWDCPQAEAVTAWAESSKGFWKAPVRLAAFSQAVRDGEPFAVLDEKEIWPALNELRENLGKEDPKKRSHLLKSLTAIQETRSWRNGGNYQWYYGGPYSWPGPDVPYFVHFTLPYEDAGVERVIEVLYVTGSKKAGTFYLMDRSSKVSR